MDGVRFGILSGLVVAFSLDALAETEHLSTGFTEPNYLIAGTNSSHLYRPFNVGDGSQLKLRLGFYFSVFRLNDDRTGIYISYTQNSFWKKSDPGSPILDNNYRPELFTYLDFVRWFERNESYYLPKLKISISRESNWVSGVNNRSWDKASCGLEIGQFGKTEFYGSFKVWNAFNLSSYNSDIKEYCGDAQIVMGYWYFDRSSLVRWGVSMDMRFRLESSDITSIATSVYFNPVVGKHFKWIPALMAEYYHGTGECLLDYNKFTNAVRIGLAFM